MGQRDREVWLLQADKTLADIQLLSISAACAPYMKEGALAHMIADLQRRITGEEKSQREEWGQSTKELAPILPRRRVKRDV